MHIGLPSSAFSHPALYSNLTVTLVKRNFHYYNISEKEKLRPRNTKRLTQNHRVGKW